jgi:uncharacterized phage protein (TIGR01671 family)
MREIKFRAWDGKKMDLAPVIYGSHEIGECWPNSAFAQRQKDGMVFMQYTGLKDKNGKEIYEGDILSLNEPRDCADVQTAFGTVEVKFGDYDDSEIDYGSRGIGWFVTGFHGFKRIGGKVDRWTIGSDNNSEWSLAAVLDWEVVGNTHENPELVKA